MVTLKELRLKKGLTQEEMAHKAKLSLKGYIQIENGYTEPRILTALKISEILDADPREIKWAQKKRAKARKL